MILKLAWRNIWRNKRRTLITCASIFLAVILAVVMRSAQLGAYQNMIDNVVSFYYGYVQVHHKGYWNEKSLDNTFVLSDSLKNVLDENKEIKNWVPRLESFALASAGNLTKGTLVVGIEPDKEKELTGIDQKISSGAFFNGEDDAGALMAEGLAAHLKLKVNDTIVLLGQGYHGTIAAGKYFIKGLIRFGSPQLNEGMVYLTLPHAQQLYGTDQRFTSIAIAVTSSSVVGEVTSQLKKDLSSLPYEVMDWKEMMPELVQAIEADSSGGIIFIAILYMIIAFGIFGTILMMMAERMHEFGIMVSVGMRRLKLAGMVMSEIFMIAAIGVLIGAVAAIPLIAYLRLHPIHLSGEMAEAYKRFGLEPIFPFSGDPSIFISQAWVVFIIGMILSVYPLIRLLHLKTFSALKS